MLKYFCLFYAIFCLHFQALEEESVSLAEDNLQYQNHISNLESDVGELVNTIKKARITGKWEVFEYVKGNNCSLLYCFIKNE